MNCDEVFEILTRGPFPTGDPSDVDVELHLGECSSCQELAEALRPALELFEEAIPAAESRNLPGYWGDQPSASTVAAEVARSAYKSRRLRKRSTEIGAWVGRWAAGPAPLLIATVAMGLSLGAVTWIIQFRAADATPDGASMQSQAAPPTVFEEDARSAHCPPIVANAYDISSRLSRIASGEGCQRAKIRNWQVIPTGNATLDPPETNDREAGGGPPAAGRMEGHVCCTGCHRPGGEIGVPANAVLNANTSCEACHGHER